MKEVTHRKESTNCQAFIKKKLLSKNIDTKATRYGKMNEAVAIQAYVNYQLKRGINVKIDACGLYIHSSESWLAASPDAIVTDFFSGGQDRGCLEVKCPLTCEKMTFHNACRAVPSLKMVHKCFCRKSMHIFTKCKPKCMLPIFTGVTSSFGHQYRNLLYNV